jgi:8-oxo-dGTP diphosphatase
VWQARGVTIHGPADGWVETPDGRRFWGRAGAAGLLAVDADDRVLLQHRVEWSHHGGTWGLPGGARQFDETAVEGALRESGEEAAVPADALRLVFESVLTVDSWSYTTVVARVERPFDAVISDSESLELAWVPRADVAALPLHPGFAASWAGLDAQLDVDVHLVVDAANVVGSRPDGWWRDRAGAATRLLGALSAAVRPGLPADLVLAEAPVGPGAATSWWPLVTVVLEGEARGADDTAPVADTASSGTVPRPVEVVRAPADGDATIVEVVDRLRSAGSSVVVVTADRELGERVRGLGAGVVGPARLLSALDGLAER